MGVIMRFAEPREAPVLLYQTIFPVYRMPLYAALKEQYGDRIQFACGEVSFSDTLKTDGSAWGIATRVENRYLGGRRLIWQSGLLRVGASPTVVIGEFNLRAASTWLLVVWRRLLRKKTILWGHAAGRGKYTEFLRVILLHLCDGFIAYTPAEARRVLEVAGRLSVKVGYNSVVWKSDCSVAPAAKRDAQDILYVGRLVEEKKVHLLVEAFVKAARSGVIDTGARLILVGAGPLKAVIEGLDLPEPVRRRIILTGHISDTGRLRDIYSQALVAVSPGPVGLAATQAFSFGVPIIVADREMHGPEFDICRPGVDTVLFASNSVAGLVGALAEVFRESEVWLSRRSAIARYLSETYTFDRMIEAFEQFIDEDQERRTPSSVVQSTLWAT